MTNTREELIDELMARIPDPSRYSEAELAEIRGWLDHVLEVSPRWVDDWGAVSILGLDGMVFTPEALGP